MSGTTTPSVSFLATDEQEQLRSMARELFGQRATSERVREVMLGDEGLDGAVWRELAGLGLTGLTIPEEQGGGGAGPLELAIVLEEAGRRLAPVPLLSSAVLGTETLLVAADEQQRARILPGVADGTTRLALAHLDATGRHGAAPGVHARRTTDGWVLQGTAGYVVDGRTASMIVTAATSDEGLQLFLVDGAAHGLRCTDIGVLDLTRPMATLDYAEVRVEEQDRLTAGAPAAGLQRALAAGAVMLANEQIGGTQQVLDMTTAHARERFQFGRAIGSFQAVKHALADILVELESARSAAHHAAHALAADDRDELAIMAPMAKAYCSEVFERASAQAIQLHGGIGFTWEHDAHLYFKRAKSTKLLLGSPRHHRRVLAEVLGLAPAGDGLHPS